MAASFNDMALISTDSTFINRVASALWQACVSIANEAAARDHPARKAYAAQILNNPNTYKPLFVNVVSVDTTVIADATQAGTVVITTGNVAAQAALATDAHMATAVSAAFNAFISGI